ncbi:Acyl-coenzyme A thioesterase THEM4 [Fusarium agapanthi]|uniref:Acyl-coenzyme A thioesterase THEM4 n=1 Tax=Fusarium agapanthi TaxID=1803897 RepID=A0A9P5B6A9_9HYPO|nr:Acyl-coenzyme A thioesterase THEM4 [Fusarium agapanthi]
MNNNASDLHHFLKVPWCAETLTAPDIKLLHEIQNPLGNVMNRGAFANGILAIPDGVRAQLAYFHQKAQESHPIGVPFPELCVMYDIGPGMAGWAGRGHGGFLSYLFDTVAGWLALLNTHHAGKLQSTPQMGEPTTMTARLAVNYRKPMVLGGVFIVTATVNQLEGKKMPEEAVDEWRTTTGEDFLVRLILGGWEHVVQNLHVTLALNKVRLLDEICSNDFREAEPLAIL